MSFYFIVSKFIHYLQTPYQYVEVSINLRSVPGAQLRSPGGYVFHCVARMSLRYIVCSFNITKLVCQNNGLYAIRYIHSHKYKVIGRKIRKTFFQCHVISSWKKYTNN